MSRFKGHRILVIASLLVVMLFAVAVTSAGAASAPGAIGKSSLSSIATPEAVVIGPTDVTPVVYVATGMNFPDALSAGPVAGITDGPILLVSTNSIPAVTAAELTRLNPDRIVIIGGTGVVSPAVATALEAYTRTVERLSGADRFATAAAVSEASFPAPHTFMVYDNSDATTQIGAACTDYDGLVLPITVPGPGTIVVEANVNVQGFHVNGQFGVADLYIGTSPTDCTANVGLGADTVFFYVHDSLPTGQYFDWLPMKRAIHVEGAGTHTFYITGKDGGDDGVYFRHAYADATFIPDPGT